MKPRMVRPLFSGQDKSTRSKKVAGYPIIYILTRTLICDVILSFHTSKKKETLFRSYHFVLLQPSQVACSIN